MSRILGWIDTKITNTVGDSILGVNALLWIFVAWSAIERWLWLDGLPDSDIISKTIGVLG